MHQVIGSSLSYHFIFIFVNREGQMTSQLACENNYASSTLILI